MTFGSTLPVTQLDAALAGVCFAPTSALRKLARKAGVTYPLLSDSGGKWISSLNVNPGGEVVIFLIDGMSETVLSSFVAKGDASSSTVVQTVKAAIEQRNQANEEAAQAYAQPYAAPSDDIPEGDELPDE